MPHNVKHAFATAALGVILTVTTACAAPSGRVYVTAVPPPPIVEVRRAAPGPAYVWVDGYHHWNGRAYVWTPGRWVAKPRSNSKWVKGHWEKSKKGYYYVEGRWR